MRLFHISLALCMGCASTFTFTPRRRNKIPLSTLFSTKPLGSEGEWTAYLDEDGTGFVYYFNGKTGESLWEPPTSTFPVVSLVGSMKRKAEEKQLEYSKSIEEEKSNKKGFFQSILEAPAEADKPKEEKRPWFSSVADDTSVKKEKPQKKEQKPVKDEKDSGFLGGMFNKVSGEEAVTQGSPQKNEKKIAVKETVAIPIKVESAAYVLPHPAKVRWGGEDAVFTKGRTFGVFDGVSGAEKLDGVPLYSKTLAEEMKRLVDKEAGLTMQELTQYMLQCAEIADETATGASTAVVASITEDGFLRALNVGDSSCIVIRNGKVAAKTREISHYFECPYQLSVDSPDRPRDGTKLNVELMRGDLILMGSDGIFDNMSAEDVVAVALKETQLSTIAKRVSELSRKVSLDSSAPTPYAKSAKRYGDPDFSDGLGGKVDDVSCVVVRYA